MESKGGMPSPPTSPWAVLGVRDFRVYWYGQFVSLIGMWMQVVALGWVVTGLTGQAKVLGTISLISSVPMTFLAMPAGVVADRFDRRKILIVSQALLAITAAIYAGLVHAGHLTMGIVYAMALVLGSIAAFDFPAQSAMVPQLVPPQMIPQAIGLNSAVFHGARFIGPGLAGALMAVTSPAAAFLANAISYLAVIYSLAIIPSRPRPAGAGKPRSGGGMMKEGLAYVWRERLVRALMGWTALVTCLLMPVFAVLMPIVARSMLHASEAGMGLVMGASGLGALVGSLAMIRIPGPLRGRAIVISTVVAATFMMLLSRMTGPLGAALCVMVLNVATAIGLGLCTTTIQIMVPDALRGRVMGVFAMTFTTVMPPFALAWGAVADAVGLSTLILALGGAFGLFALALLGATGIWSMNPRPSAAMTGERASAA